MGQFQNKHEAEMHSFMNDGAEPAAPEASPDPNLYDGYDQQIANEYDENGAAYEEAYEPAPRDRGTRIQKLPLVIGGSMLILGLVLGYFSTSETKAVVLLTRLGLTPALLFIAGTLAITLALSHRVHSSSSSTRMLTALDDELDSIRQDVTILLNDGFAGMSSTGAGGEHLGQFMIMFQKIENMIKNLTKATRMHSKPLMDLVGQVSDIQRSLQDLVEKFQVTLTNNKNMLVAFEKKFENLMERHLDQGARLEEGIGKTVAKELEQFTRQQAESGGSSGIDPLSIATLQQNVQKILDGISSGMHATHSRAAAEPDSSHAAAPAAPGVKQAVAAAGPGDAPTQSGVVSAIERLRQLRGS